MLLLLAALPAAAAPVPPFSPYGTVKVDGANADAGAAVSAWCAGVRYGLTEVSLYQDESWYFNLDVWGDDPDTPAKDGCAPGETISFMIGDLPANETAAWSSSAPRLDLTAQRQQARPLYLPLIVR